MSKLALAVPANRPLYLSQRVSAAIGDECREKAYRLKALMVRLDATKTSIGRGMGKEYARVAASSSTPISADRLGKLHRDWERRGIAALIDHRLCCGRCEEADCDNRGRRSLLHPATIAAWTKLAQEYQANGQNPRKSRSYQDAWRVLLNKLAAGEKIAGVNDGHAGTWHDLLRRVDPMATLDGECPWNTAQPPPGWTLQNFMLHKPSARDHAAATAGMQVMMDMLPEVRFDYSKIRPQEYLLIDDKRIDVKVYGKTPEGKRWKGSLNALFIMDLCTRRIVGVQLHPSYPRPDGTERGIERRDVQHLLADYVRHFGLPKGYTTTVVHENAAAAVTADCKALFDRVTEGRMAFRATGLWDGSMMVAGFCERGGAPRDKAPLESYFGHRWDVAFGRVKGQIGGSYQRTPGAEHGRNLEAGRILSKFGDVATDAELEILMPYHSVDSIRPHILRCLQEIEQRTDHELQGFEEIMQWRWDLTSPWLPMNHPAMVGMPDTAATMLLQTTGLSQSRMESPVERWQRLRVADDFEAVHPMAWMELWLDSFATTYDGRNAVRGKVERRGVVEFRGAAHSLMPGDKVTVHFNADDLAAGCWLKNEAGRNMGSMVWSGRSDYGELEGMQRQLGEHQSEFHRAITGHRELHQDATTLEQQIEEARLKTDTISTIKARVGGILPAPESSTELAAAMAGTARPRRGKRPTAADDLAALEAEAARTAKPSGTTFSWEQE